MAKTLWWTAAGALTVAIPCKTVQRDLDDISDQINNKDHVEEAHVIETVIHGVPQFSFTVAADLTDLIRTTNIDYLRCAQAFWDCTDQQRLAEQLDT